MLQLNDTSRAIAIHLLAIFFVMLNISSIEIAGLPKAFPLFDVMIIFYFTVFRNFFAIWFIFLLGVWADALNGDPLGLSSLCYILLIKFFWAMNERMIIRDNFVQILKQFTIFCFLFLLMKWSMLSAFNQVAYNVVVPTMQLILSSVFYVLIHKFCSYFSNQLFENN